MSPSLTGSLVPAHETANTPQCCYRRLRRQTDIRQCIGGRRMQPFHREGSRLTDVNERREDRPVSELAAGTREDRKLLGAAFECVKETALSSSAEASALRWKHSKLEG